MSVDWAKIRAEFPALENWIYLNTATYGQMPRRGTDAVLRHFAHRDELACSDFLQWFDEVDQVRSQVGRLIHCNADDVAFVQNASAALAVLINGIAWNAGDRVVALQGEFPNNLYFPAVLSERGVDFVEAPLEEFEAAITPATRLVLMSTVNYTTGFRPDVARIAKFLRERDVLFYLDGTQSVGALQFDISAVKPDVFAVNAYKWLLSPNGAAFVYISPELRKTLPPNVIGWRSDQGWRGVDQLNQGAPRFSETAEKYEGGMLNFAAIAAMSASLQMMLDIGPDVIEKRVMDLAAATRHMLRNAGASILHEDAPIIAARFEGRDASQLARDLKERRILVSARHGNLRVSVHIYNNEDDIEALRLGLS